MLQCEAPCSDCGAPRRDSTVNAIVNPPPQSADDDGPSINPLEIVQFIWKSVRRNPLVCFVVGMLTLALGLAIVSALPRRYESTSKIFVSNTGLITLQLTNGRAPNTEASAKDLREIIFNHDTSWPFCARRGWWRTGPRRATGSSSSWTGRAKSCVAHARARTRRRCCCRCWSA